jgi:hypothetical protein
MELTMTHMSPLLIVATVLSLAAPAFAGTAGVDLPRLTFPAPTTPSTGQGCPTPATLTTTRCERTGG